MDPAGFALAHARPDGLPQSYRALADHAGVPCSTLHHRARGRRSLRAKAECQQYLTPAEEQAVVEFLLHMSSVGQPVRMKHVPSIAFSATRQSPTVAHVTRVAAVRRGRVRALEGGIPR